jgi:hypothetical protein
MAKLNEISDPTLDAINRELERIESEKKPRGYLGASGIGHECERKAWLDFRMASVRNIDARGLRRIEDGHRGEALMAERLRLVPGVKLVTHEEDDGRQIGFVDIGGHFRGHLDGLITGLLQAPRAKHVWENKVVDQKKVDELAKLKASLGEKNALAKWETVYYAQAQLYMHYFGVTRHYLTVCSPGVRDVISCRTEYDADVALRLVAKARRVIVATQPAPPISSDPSWYQCRWCDHWSICHDRKIASSVKALSGCRTCLHSTPVENGQWRCERFNKILALDDQLAGCPAHLFVPALVPGEQVDAGEDWVEYRLEDETVWRDGVQPGAK